MLSSKSKWMSIGFSVFLISSIGCSVNNQKAEKSIPIDLRSSSDDTRPFVGVANVPATQPVSQFAQWEQLPVTLYDMLTKKNVMAAEGLRADSPNVRRMSINVLISRYYGKTDDVYRNVYRTTAAMDTDPVVRATAVRAINRSRDNDSGITLTRALDDGSAMVRLEAAKALANIPTPQAEPKLRRVLANENEDPDVRIAAADALRHFQSTETQRQLIDMLKNQNFALAWQSRRSLYLMTGEDFRYDEAAWLKYLVSKG